MSHDPTYMASNCGRWVWCSCGWKFAPPRATRTDVQLAHGRHLVDVHEQQQQEVRA